jgi:hypothetical protein
VLEDAKPDWTPKVVQTVQDKLSKVGIVDFADLQQVSSDEINYRLQTAGLRKLNEETLDALKGSMSSISLRSYERDALTLR